ncbi:MAG: STAS domain-containing protein [Lachnospiraceae bacterium]|nr:STAS domain-containing protein [Lachnospiraceae bacterium]
MTIEEIRSEDSIQLNVEGKIDTFSNDEFQRAVLGSFQTSRNLIINFEKVEHITSIGLRTLILGQKTASAKGGKLVVINANDTVKDIFRVTGFDKLLIVR